MGRIRTVKPEQFQHGHLFDAEVESGFPLRLAFIGLFTCCDREGRFKWRPRELKLSVLPHDSYGFSRVLDALAMRGFIRRYESESEVYGCIPSWSRHQVINNRESESRIPEPPKIHDVSEMSTCESHVDDTSGTRAKGKVKEGKGTGKERNTSRAKRESDARHAEFRDLVQSYWTFKNPEIAMPWNASEAAQLSLLLDANPVMEKDLFKQLLNFRAKSDVNHAERPRAWLAKVTDYARGPLNSFNKPMRGDRGVKGKT